MNKTITFIFVLITFITFGQNCRLVSNATDKKTGNRSYSGIVNSDDYYSMLFNKTKTKRDSILKNEYSLLLHAASKGFFPESILNSYLTLELILSSGNKLEVDSVKCSNNPLGMGRSVGFKAALSESEIQSFQNDPIVTLLVKDIFSTTFSGKTLKQQKDIAACLLKY